MVINLFNCGGINASKSLVSRYVPSAGLKAIRGFKSWKKRFVFLSSEQQAKS